VSQTSPLFRFTQFELPWPLGPPDGRYLVRADGDGDGRATHVVVFATLGAPQRRLLPARRRARPAEPEPDPEAVATGRATVIEVGDALGSPGDAQAWLSRAGEDALGAGLEVLNRSLRAFRLASADHAVHPVRRAHAIAARVGYGAGEQVADGLWTEARSFPPRTARAGSRRTALAPQAALAAVLGARRPPLVCEELALRTRSDVDDGRLREAALQLMIALDAALAELPSDPAAGRLRERLTELRAHRDAIGEAAQAALSGALSGAAAETVILGLERLEATLRARGVALS
jgi:hypothetical protein